MASRGIIPVRAAANIGGVLTFLTYATNNAQATIFLRNADGSASVTQATVYTNENGSTPASQPRQADANCLDPSRPRKSLQALRSTVASPRLRHGSSLADFR